MGDVRPEVLRLAAWAPLPLDEDWTEYDLERYAADASAVEMPISTAERLLLMQMLNMATLDDAFGVTNVVRALIESAPHPPYWWRDLDTSIPWYELLKIRGDNLERFSSDHDPGLETGECRCSVAGST